MITRRMPGSKITRKEAEAERAYLRDNLATLNKMTTIYTHVEHVSTSGMYRWISVRALGILQEEPVLWNISYHVARTLRLSSAEVNGTAAIGIQGCGMDMAWAIVHELSHALYGDDRLRKESL